MKTRLFCAFALAVGGVACGQQSERSTPFDLDKEGLRAVGTTPALCEKLGFEPECDICAEMKWYYDGECDQDLYEAGICRRRDVADCAAAEPTAFRLDHAELRDPHVFIPVGSCMDATSIVNDQLADKINADENNDGVLDISVLSVFRPYDPNAASVAIEVGRAACAAPAPGSGCTLNDDAVATTADQLAMGTCLAPIAGTTDPESEVTNSIAPCYSTAPMPLALDIGNGIVLNLKGARTGGTFATATTISNGLVMGFMSEADADALILPDDVPIVGGQPLSSVLPGGKGSCQTEDGRDAFIDENGTRVVGWYFYLNNTAGAVELAGS